MSRMTSSPPSRAGGPRVLLVPERATVTAQLAAILRGLLRDGEWTGLLPAERQLAERFQVSRPTLRLALEILQREGLVERRAGRRTRVTVKRGARRRAVPSRVVLLSPLPVVETSSMPFLISAMQRHLRQVDCELEVVIDRRVQSQAPEAVVASLTQHAAVRCWLLISLSPAVQRVFQQRRLPSAVVGTRGEDIRLPAVDLDYRAACRHAVGLFLKYGHRHLGLVAPRRLLPGDQAGIDGVREALAASRFANLTFRLIRHSGTTEDIRKALGTAFGRPSPPTALLVFKPLDVISVVTWLQDRGFRIPKDVSVLSRDDRDALDRIIPSLSHYKADRARFALLLSREIRSIIRTGRTHDRQVFIEPEYVPGASLGSPGQGPHRPPPPA